MLWLLGTSSMKWTEISNILTISNIAGGFVNWRSSEKPFDESAMKISEMAFGKLTFSEVTFREVLHSAKRLETEMDFGVRPVEMNK